MQKTNLKSKTNLNRNREKKIGVKMGRAVNKKKKTTVQIKHKKLPYKNVGNLFKNLEIIDTIFSYEND